MVFRLTEKIFSDEDTQYVNVDQFETGAKNVLLITGQSGSGKSTLAAQLANKYSAIHYKLDALSWYVDGLLSFEKLKETEEGFAAFVTKFDIPPVQLSESKLKELYKKYIPFLIEFCKRHSSQKFIIEGLQIFQYADNTLWSKIQDYPLIILGTSAINSAKRATARNVKNYGTDKVFQGFSSTVQNLANEPKLKKFRKQATSQAQK